ncbi:copper uptake system-associated protein [Pseudolabrys taiwanensis]|nr:copper uptake system-associated protein [Pseudolabrys taiwanensis]
MMAQFDKPDAPLTVAPVVIVADHAIAGWTQADMGGRALLRRKNGVWAIVLCAGDQLTTSEALRMAGLSDDHAQSLIAALSDAESKIAPERIAMFGRFEGLVTMDDHGGHPPHHH